MAVKGCFTSISLSCKWIAGSDLIILQQVTLNITNLLQLFSVSFKSVPRRGCPPAHKTFCPHGKLKNTTCLMKYILPLPRNNLPIALKFISRPYLVPCLATAWQCPLITSKVLLVPPYTHPKSICLCHKKPLFPHPLHECVLARMIHPHRKTPIFYTWSRRPWKGRVGEILC